MAINYHNFLIDFEMCQFLGGESMFQTILLATAAASSSFWTSATPTNAKWWKWQAMHISTDVILNLSEPGLSKNRLLKALT